MPEGVCDSGTLLGCQDDCMSACMRIACCAIVARVRIDSADMCARTAQANVLSRYIHSRS
jgi:hypothetical protein